MKNGLLFATMLGLAVVAAQPEMSAQTQPASTTLTDQFPHKKGILNAALPPWLRLSGSIRGRWEDGFVSMKGDVQDAYYLDRVRLNVALIPTSWLSVVAELQDTRAWGYNHGVPMASQQDPFDLRQGYIQLGGGETSGQWLRAGRQEVMLGAGRIFTSLDWSNNGRSFDILRSAFYRPGVKLEILEGSVVNPDGERFDRHRPGEHFYGTYNTLDKLIPGASLEPYFFVKTQMNVTGELGGPAGSATLFIPGVRFAGKAGRVDYSLELLHQGGSYSRDSVSALGGTYTLGWTFSKSGWRPRVSGDYSHSSGDKNPKGGVHRTFDQLYGGFWPFSSLTGLFGWKNIRDLRTGVDVTPFRNFKVLVDYRDIHLATTQDSLYNSSGTSAILYRNATSTHVGDGLDIQLIYSWPHGFSTATGVGTLFSGEYLHQAGQHSTYVYPYFTWTKRFL
jgi:hypothetical protein